MEQMKVNGHDYTVIKLLGKGKGGYSYLVTRENRQYVLKQIHHEPCAYYQFGNKLEAELHDYERLQKLHIPMPKLIEVDQKLERIIKEYIDGDTVYDLILQDQMCPNYLNQVKAMCQQLYSANINIDYFPTNFVLQSEVLYYIDYECNDYMEEWNFENWGIKYWSKTKEFLEYIKEHAEVILEPLNFE